MCILPKHYLFIHLFIYFFIYAFILSVSWYLRLGGFFEVAVVVMVVMAVAAFVVWGEGSLVQLTVDSKLKSYGLPLNSFLSNHNYCLQLSLAIIVKSNTFHHQLNLKNWHAFYSQLLYQQKRRQLRIHCRHVQGPKTTKATRAA